MYSASYEGGAAATRVPQNYNGNYDFVLAKYDYDPEIFSPFLK